MCVIESFALCKSVLNIDKRWASLRYLLIKKKQNIKPYENEKQHLYFQKSN
jgi:hypothetical protein